MDTPPKTIAIDGPAASGKSTVGQIVADRLGFLYFDTGVLYRVVTCLAVEQQLDLNDGARLGELATETLIEIEVPDDEERDGRQNTVRALGRDLTWQIRHHLVDQNVSRVAALPEVRQALIHQQRRIGQRGKVVMVGRDIGTVVMVDAPLKIYLDASIEERARRRYEESRQRGQPADYESMLGHLRRRDQFDSTRALSPLRPAPDALIINSSEIGAEAVADLILERARERLSLDNPVPTG